MIDIKIDPTKILEVIGATSSAPQPSRPATATGEARPPQPSQPPQSGSGQGTDEEGDLVKGVAEEDLKYTLGLVRAASDSLVTLQKDWEEVWRTLLAD